MSRTIITKLAVSVVIALCALIAVQAASARTLPKQKVSVATALARIQHPGGVTELARLKSLRGGPTGVYSLKGSGIVIPAALAGIMHPGGVYVTR